MSSESTPQLSAMPAPLKTETSAKNRCVCCSKKLTLADFACGKCQIRYCGQHRLPEAHSCGHDFKATGRDQLTKQLTRVVGDKITHI